MRRLLILVAVLALLAPSALAVAATDTNPTESYAALVAQIDSGQVVIAHVNEETRHISVTLKNGTEQLVFFSESQHKVLIDSLLHHGVTPIYSKHVTAAKPVHHVLRYIAAGVVVVLLLIGAGVWTYTRGQRQPPATEGSQPGSDPPAATGEPTVS